MALAAFPSPAMPANAYPGGSQTLWPHLRGQGPHLQRRYGADVLSDEGLLSASGLALLEMAASTALPIQGVAIYICPVVRFIRGNSAYVFCILGQVGFLALRAIRRFYGAALSISLNIAHSIYLACANI
jgi:hypothetical protein